MNVNLFKTIADLEPKVFSSAFANCENICIFSQKEPDEIYSNIGQKVFRTIKMLQERGDVATITTVYPLLKSDVEKEFLIRISECSTNSFEYESLINQYDDGIRRLKVIDSMKDALSAMEKGEPDADDRFIQCSDIFYNTADTKKLVTAKDLCKISIPDISKSIHYTPFGISSLDTVVNGAYDGQFICFAGSPGAGKSTAALQAAKYQSTREPVLFFSLEMSAEELYVKMI